MWRGLIPKASLCRDSGLLTICSVNLFISLLTVQGKPNKAPCLMSYCSSFSGDLRNPTKYSKDHRICLFQLAEILALGIGRDGEGIFAHSLVKTLSRMLYLTWCANRNKMRIRPGCPGCQSNNVMDTKEPKEILGPWWLWPVPQRLTGKSFTLVHYSRMQTYLQVLPWLSTPLF